MSHTVSQLRALRAVIELLEEPKRRTRAVGPLVSSGATTSECIILLPAVRGPSVVLHELKNGVSGLPSAGRATSSRPVIP
jgi:hypothetical protein